ncbi:MAG: carboxypeptidase regulatory-like domain-containing protein, partial [Planctomycetota bacterium]|nr:carboxypeptidase regulatory-like domain-containing protein [Planctomycetota bacterium]
MGSRNVLLAVVAMLGLGGALWWFIGLDASGGGSSSPTPEIAVTPTADRGQDPAELAGAEALEPLGAQPGPERTAVDTPEPGELAAPEEKEDLEGAPHLSGRVVDSFGNPVAGADVYASDRTGFALDYVKTSHTNRWARRWQAATDESGRFELRGPKPGSLRLAVRADGYAPLDEEGIPLPVATDYQLEDLVLRRGAVLAGQVIDHVGRGVAGAELMRRQSDNPFAFFSAGFERRPAAVSDASGFFEINQLAAGPWKVQVDHEDHPTRTFEGLAERPGERVADLVFQLEEGTTIAGRVVDVPAEERGKLEIRATSREQGGGWFGLDLGSGRTADVDDEGNFVVRGAGVGKSYHLQARLKPESGRDIFFQRTRSDRVSALAGDRGVAVPYQPESALLFQVVDASTGAPLTEFRVSAGLNWPEPLFGEDDRPLLMHPEGRVRFGNLRPSSADDKAALEIEATGYETYRRDDVVIAPGQDLDLGIIRLDPIPVLRVTVLDTSTGEPIENARVSLQKQVTRSGGNFALRRRIEVTVSHEDHEVIEHGGGNRTASTDADGVAEVSSIEGETCVVRVSHSDFAPLVVNDLFLPVGEVVERTMKLTRGGAVVVEVLDPDGLPLAGARVNHRPPEGGGGMAFSGFLGGGSGRARNVTDTEGKVVFDHLAEGLHGFKLAESRRGGSGGAFFGAVMLEQAGGQPDPGWSEVAVVEGESASLRLWAEPVGILTGRVRETGVDLAGATVQLNPDSEGDDNLFGGRLQILGMGSGGVRTDGDGRYLFEDVKAGRYELVVTHPKRRMPMGFEVEIEAGRNVLDVDLPVSVIEGRITDTEGDPLAGVRVSAQRATGDDGG